MPNTPCHLHPLRQLHHLHALQRCSSLALLTPPSSTCARVLTLERPSPADLL